MPEIPFSHQWTISENDLLPLKDSDYGYLCSTLVTNIPEFKQFMAIYPNGHNDQYRGKTLICLQVKLINVKKVEADWIFTIESANYSEKFHDIYEESKGRGISICSTEEFFDPKKKFIVDGKCTVKINGIFKFEIEDTIPVAIKQKWIGGKLGDEFWKKDDTKDFTIITSDGKEIKAHKFVLANRSEVFNTTFDLKNESTAEISDFSFKVVEAGLKLIYECNFTSLLITYELMELLQLFDKFGLSALKVDVEPYLIARISPFTVVFLANGSILTNSFKLIEKCMEFLMAAFVSKTALFRIRDLNKDIAFKILENSQSQTSEIDGPSTSDSAITEQKWRGGYLGDKMWNDHETKDFTIFVDGEQIKAHKFILGVQSQMFKEISKETNENEAEIFNFPFKVVEIGIKFIYECNFTSSLSMDEFMSLQHFFDKYHLPELKAKVEPLLIAQISPSTVCRLTNCSILANSPKLKNSCIKYLIAAFASKTPLTDFKTLNKDIALQILDKFL